MTADSAPATALSLKDLIRALYLEGVQTGMEAAADIDGHQAIMDSRDREKAELSRFFDEHWDDADWPVLAELRALLSPPSETREIEEVSAVDRFRILKIQAMTAALDERDREIERMRAENERLEAEIERLCRITAMGGYASDAPEEMILYGDESMGCDAWLNVWRVSPGSRPTWATEPVRYVRALNPEARP